MAVEQNAIGHFETPDIVADLLMGFCLRRPADRVLDPGCGMGTSLQRAAKWLDWLAANPADLTPEGLLGLERDPQLAKIAQSNNPVAQIRTLNFFTLLPTTDNAFEAIIGNPPFTRSQLIGQIESIVPQQLSLFSWQDQGESFAKMPLISSKLAGTLSGRSGLHGYYILHSTDFLVEGGRLGFVVPNAWLDVAHGTELKQFLLDHFRVLAIIESSVERWLPEASVNTCLVILEKCGRFRRRSANPVRLIRLKQPLEKLIPQDLDDSARFLAIEKLVARLSPVNSRNRKEFMIHIIRQGKLKATDKWGMALRAPAVFRRTRDPFNQVPLTHWARIQRGYTTGANEFFYLDERSINEWSIEPHFRHALLKSLRGITHLQITPEKCRQEVLLIPVDAELKGTAVEQYIKWGEEQGFHQRQTCATRFPWYSLPEQDPAPLVLPKGIWNRHFAPMINGPITVDQQLYRIELRENVPILAAAALLNSAWFALQVELQGRVNLGKGLLWLAGYELENVRLPDPRRLSTSYLSALEKAIQPMLQRPLGDSVSELKEPDRETLDQTVFDLLGFSATERSMVLESYQERLFTRRQFAEGEVITA